MELKKNIFSMRYWILCMMSLAVKSSMLKTSVKFQEHFLNSRSKECVTHILKQHYVRELPFPVLMIKNSDLILMSLFVLLWLLHAV